MRVLITGGAGFIGTHVVEALAANRHEPVVLDLTVSTRSLPGKVIRGDVRDADTLDRVLPGVDAVVHHAAKVGLGVDMQDMPFYADTNVTGTASLLAAMHRTRVRQVVLASSMVVYGEGRYRCHAHGVVRPLPRRPADLDAGLFEPGCPRCGVPLGWLSVPESAAMDPRNTYAATKVAQEHLVLAWASATGGVAVALRYHNVYGPRMPTNTPYAGVAAIFRSAIVRGDEPMVYEDGSQLRDFVHVRDVAAANVVALERLSLLEPGQLEAYNVASGEPRSVGELAATLSDVLGGPAPRTTGQWRAGDVRHIVASPAAARGMLGFSAQVKFADGIRELASSHR